MPNKKDPGNGTGDKDNVLEMVKGGKRDHEWDTDNHSCEHCVDALQHLDDVKEQIKSGHLTSMILFALTDEGLLTRTLLSRNSFELIGLADEVDTQIQQYRSEYRSDWEGESDD
jgi:hypothetical protein